MTPIEPPAAPSGSELSTPTEAAPTLPSGPAPTLAKGARPKQCERSDGAPQPPITLAVGEIKTLTADLVQYAVSDEQIIQVDATASSLKITARRSGRAEIWYTNAAGDCTVLELDTSAHTIG